MWCRLCDDDPLLIAGRGTVEQALRKIGRDDLVTNVRELPVFTSRARKTLWGFHQTRCHATGLGRIVLCCPVRERLDTLLHEYAHAIVQWIGHREEDDHGPRFQWWLNQLGGKL